MKVSALFSLGCAALASARTIPFTRRQSSNSSFVLQNGEEAIALK